MSPNCQIWVPLGSLNLALSLAQMLTHHYFLRRDIL